MSDRFPGRQARPAHLYAYLLLRATSATSATSLPLDAASDREFAGSNRKRKAYLRLRCTVEHQVIQRALMMI